MLPSPLVLPSMRQHFLQVQGHRLAVLCANEENGSLPVVLLHGITEAFTFWTHALPREVQEGRRWYSLTLPGHFPAVLPESGRTGMTPEELGPLLNDAIGRLIGEEPFIIFGRSTGGYAALVLAATVPERVRGVIAESGWASGRWRGTLGIMQRLGSQEPLGAALFRIVMGLSTLNPALYERVLSLYAIDKRAYWASEVREQVAHAVHAYARRHNAEALRKLFVELRGIEIWDLLPRIKVPALVLGGREDSAYPVGHQREIAAHIPSSELYLFDGAGHMLFAERRPAYVRIINTWLERHFPTS